MVPLAANDQENPMKALILRSDAKASVETARALIDKGFQILMVDTLAVAQALIRVDVIDLLVMDERVEGQLTHAIALSGERRSPYLSTILLTDRPAEQTDDLYDLIPCLYGLAGSDTAPELLAKLALSAVSNIETALARVAKAAAIEAAEAAEAVQLERLILPQTAMTPPDDDTESGAPCYAVVAIARPAMAEIAASEQQVTPEKVAEFVSADVAIGETSAVRATVQDAVNAEVAALFRKHPLPHHVHAALTA